MSGAMTGVLLVVLCAFVEGIAQVFLKKSALVPDGKRLWIAAGVVLFVVQALIYTAALRFVEVSTAFPIGSIGLVVVAVLSRKYLRERLTRTRWTGIGLIIAGVTLLAAGA